MDVSRASMEKKDMILKTNQTNLEEKLFDHSTNVELFKYRTYYYSIYCSNHFFIIFLVKKIEY